MLGIGIPIVGRLPRVGGWGPEKTMEPASAVRFLAIAMETAVCFDAYTGGFGSGGLGIYGDGR